MEQSPTNQITRTEAHERYGFLVSEGRKRKKEADVLRMLCRKDLFFLLVYICGRKDLDDDFHFARSRDIMAEPDGMMDVWCREHGKDLADNTPMLTINRGWTTHGNLKVGDKVFHPNGYPVKIVALSERYNNNNCYRITFEAGESIVCGGGHLWSLRKKSKPRINKTNKRNTVFNIEIIPTYQMYELSKENKRMDVGVADPIQYSEKVLPIDPYTFGAWLGDGHSCSATITIAYSDYEIIEKIEKNGIAVNETKSSNLNTGSFRLNCGIKGKRGTGMTSVLNNMKVKNNKRIPDIYMTASISQRMELLRGLMDTDGTCNTRGTATFVNINTMLAKQVYELAVGLGLQPNIRLNKAKNNTSKAIDGFYYSWQISFQAHTDRNPFSLKRKVERAVPASHYRGIRTVKNIEQIPSVPTRCIQVEGDGNYCAGYELIPTHNSSMITFGKSLQDILVNPEERICIFSHTKTVASDHLQPIKYEMEESNKLKKLFPDILYVNPSKQSPKWTEDAIQVKRRGNYVENTVEASGLIDALRTGMHHTILVWDDVLNEKNVTNPEMINKTMEAVNSSTNLTSRGYRKRGVGTYYHFNDPYVQMISRGILRERLFPGTTDGTVTGAPVWWTPEQLADRRKTLTPYQFACQVLCNPKMESKYGFDMDWWKTWPTVKRDCWKGMNILILVDPANEKKKVNDYTVFTVIGLGADHNIYVVEWVRDRLSLEERTDVMFRLHRKYGRSCKAVYYEKYGMQADISHIEYVMKMENYRFTIKSVGGNIEKNDRISCIVPMVKEGEIYIPEECLYRTVEGKQIDLTQIFLNEEARPWPFGSHDDMLDTLARIKSPEVHLPFPDMNQANVNYQPAGQPRESQDGGYNPIRQYRESNGLRAA